MIICFTDNVDYCLTFGIIIDIVSVLSKQPDKQEIIHIDLKSPSKIMYERLFANSITVT